MSIRNIHIDGNLVAIEMLFKAINSNFHDILLLVIMRCCHNTRSHQPAISRIIPEPMVVILSIDATIRRRIAMVFVACIAYAYRTCTIAIIEANDFLVIIAVSTGKATRDIVPLLTLESRSTSSFISIDTLLSRSLEIEAEGCRIMNFRSIFEREHTLKIRKLIMQVLRQASISTECRIAVIAKHDIFTLARINLIVAKTTEDNVIAIAGMDKVTTSRLFILVFFINILAGVRHNERIMAAIITFRFIHDNKATVTDNNIVTPSGENRIDIGTAKNRILTIASLDEILSTIKFALSLNR